MGYFIFLNTYVISLCSSYFVFCNITTYYDVFLFLFKKFKKILRLEKFLMRLFKTT